MEEDITKSLTQKSIINTSEDFTDKLLLKIESKKAKQPLLDIQHIRVYRFALLGMIGVSALFFLLIFFGFLPKFNIFNFQLKISKTPLLIITTLFLLLGTNHMLKIHQLAMITW